MRKPPVRLGLVGCGRLAAQGYAPAVAATRGATAIVAVADPDPGRRNHLAGVVRTTGDAVRPYATVDELVAAGGLDAVVVASPVDRHVADVTACVAAGLPVLVEKPPAPDVDGARALAALTPCPWLGLNRRFDLGVRRVRAAVPPAGAVQVVLQLAYRRASWRAHTVRDDALLDLGPHVIDLAAWLTRSPVRAVRDAELTTERARMVLVLDRGEALVELACDRPYRELVEVRDLRGALLARHTQGGPTAAVRDRIARGPHPLVATLTGELEAVARAVRGEGVGALADARDGIAVMAAIEAARASADADGRAVELACDSGEVVPCS